MKRFYFIFLVVFMLSIINVDAKGVMDYNVGDDIKFNPIYNNICETGDNCYTFQVISKNQSLNTIDIMMKENLVDAVFWAGYDDTSKLGCTSQEYGCSWYGPVTALKALKEATDSWNVDYVSADKNVTVSLQYDGTVFGTYTIDYTKYKARLISSNEILSLCGGNTNPSRGNCPDWLTSTVDSSKKFWTSTGSNSDRAYFFGVGRGDYLDSYYLNYQKAGIRPVITISDKNVSDNSAITNNESKISVSGKYTIMDKVKKFVSEKYSENSEEYLKFKDLFKSYDNFVAYNLEILDKDNKKINFNEKVEVKIPLPSGFDKEKTKVWYVDENYNKEEIISSIVNDYVIFKTNHFSNYIITTGDVEIVEVEDTAFSITKIGITIGLVIFVLGIMVIIQSLLKKKVNA